MADAKLTKHTFCEGVWHGRMVREDGADGPAPDLSAWHLEAQLEGPEVKAASDGMGLWDVKLKVPSEILSDGVQTILIRDDASGETLADVRLITGTPVDQDIRAEMELLRAELDMLKRAFRRHCVETT